MAKKWVLITAGVAAAAILLVGGQLLLAGRTSSRTVPAEQAAGVTATPSPSAASQGATATEPGSSAQTTSPSQPPGVIAPLPGGAPLKPIKPAGPATAGSALHPLSAAPPGLVAGFSAGRARPGAAHTITFRPWGYGPADRWGQTVVATVIKTTPTGDSPDISALMRGPVLLVMDAPRGGNVAAGGFHTATLTFAADGARLVPTLSNVEALPQ